MSKQGVCQIVVSIGRKFFLILAFENFSKRLFGQFKVARSIGGGFQAEMQPGFPA